MMKNNDSFFEDVYAVVRLIPYGRVTSYGAIANYLSIGKAARMVGWAMNKSFSEKNFVPAHRVVNRNGMLTGKHYFSSENAMAELLQSEGIIVQDDQIQNFDQVFWDPAKELEGGQ
jgi:methylated-DNA-protein-cysteine methyltransferase-like protein